MLLVAPNCSFVAYWFLEKSCITSYQFFRTAKLNG